jgi:hypothetical protein
MPSALLVSSLTASLVITPFGAGRVTAPAESFRRNGQFMMQLQDVPEETKPPAKFQDRLLPTPRVQPKKLEPRPEKFPAPLPGLKKEPDRPPQKMKPVKGHHKTMFA